MVPVQRELIPELPAVVGNKEFRELRSLLARIDVLLLQSGVEQEFISSFPQSRRDTPKRVKRLTVALRCTILRMLFQLSYRRAAREIAMSHLYQGFCGLIQVDVIKTPSSTALEEYEKLVPVEVVQGLITRLNLASAFPMTQGDGRGLSLEKPLVLDVEFVDATALKAPVHHPIDWLLLRDASRTLILAIKQVRKRGIVNRMPKTPDTYLRGMNKLCIQMTHARRTQEANRHRKQILRQMKKQLRTVEGHARGHLQKLHKLGASKGLSHAIMTMLEGKFRNILDQVDAVIRQAHERIIGGRRVKNSGKTLSLYEPDLHVIVRGKAGAEVEFGNTLFLAEQADGLIVDWHLYRDQAPADCKMIPGHLERMAKERGIAVKSITGDRGFDSAANSESLQGKIENNICPRDIHKLNKRLEHKGFRDKQTRRAQTEARIAIIARKFTGNPAHKWGYANKERFCAWAILTHNLWVLARLPQRAGTLTQAA